MIIYVDLIDMNWYADCDLNASNGSALHHSESKTEWKFEVLSSWLVARERCVALEFIASWLSHVLNSYEMGC